MNFTPKQARRYANKNQQETAKSLGVCRDTYADWEAHPEKFTIPYGKKFATIVGIPFDQVIFFPIDSTSK
jgi:DNA-binding XRE family transcriptional regulator